MHFKTQSDIETRTLGKRIGRCLAAGDVLFMFGDLGAGKTTLAQGITRGLDVPENEYVRSPTFTLINQYQGKHPINHIDLYRLDDLNAIDQLGLEDVITEDSVTLIEWAEKLGPIDRSNRLPLGIPYGWRIRLESLDESTRNIEVIPLGKAPTGHLLLTLQ